MRDKLIYDPIERMAYTIVGELCRTERLSSGYRLISIISGLIEKEIENKSEYENLCNKIGIKPECNHQPDFLISPIGYPAQLKCKKCGIFYTTEVKTK